MGEVTLFWFQCVYETSGPVPIIERIHVIVYFVIQSLQWLWLWYPSILLNRWNMSCQLQSTRILLFYFYGCQNLFEMKTTKILIVHFCEYISLVLKVHYFVWFVLKNESNVTIYFTSIAIQHRTLINRDVRLQKKLSRKLN